MIVQHTMYAQRVRSGKGQKVSLCTTHDIKQAVMT